MDQEALAGVWLSGGGANLCIHKSVYSKWGKGVELRPVHTKHDNYKDNDKDIVLKIVIKE